MVTKLMALIFSGMTGQSELKRNELGNRLENRLVNRLTKLIVKEIAK